MSTVLPENILGKMNDADRAKLGRAGMTAEEAQAAFIAKNEAQLQTQIQQLLQRNGIFVVRQRTDKRSTVKVGCPDILFAIAGPDGRGIPVAWEVKMPGKKPRPEQERALADMAQNGWRTAVVTTYDQARALLGEIQGAGT